jgi:hypothetical protein
VDHIISDGKAVITAKRVGICYKFEIVDIHFVECSFNGSARDVSKRYQPGYSDPRKPSKGHCSMRETVTFTHNHKLAKADAMARKKENCLMLLGMSYID